jgi:hypothetical protein
LAEAEPDEPEEAGEPDEPEADPDEGADEDDGEGDADAEEVIRRILPPGPRAAPQSQP